MHFQCLLDVNNHHDQYEFTEMQWIFRTNLVNIVVCSQKLQGKQIKEGHIKSQLLQKWQIHLQLHIGVERLMHIWSKTRRWFSSKKLVLKCFILVFFPSSADLVSGELETLANRFGHYFKV